MEMKRVLILGSGTMGRQIGWVAAMAGFEVVIHDVSDTLLEKAGAGILKMAEQTVKNGGLAAGDMETALNRIVYEADAATAARDVDIVSESIPEDPILKGTVFARFHTLCPEHTIFTTNTSTLKPSLFADASGRPEKLVALHFHVPEVDRVVDLMPHPKTSKETLVATRAFAEAMNLIVIELKQESSGYVFNSMFSSLLGSALTLAAKGVAEPRDVDRAWMGIMQTAIGPFGMMDQVGLETIHTITKYWAEKKKDPQRLANADYLKGFLDKGQLGMKTGQGFYEYPVAEWMAPDFVK